MLEGQSALSFQSAYLSGATRLLPQPLPPGYSLLLPLHSLLLPLQIGSGDDESENDEIENHDGDIYDEELEEEYGPSPSPATHTFGSAGLVLGLCSSFFSFFAVVFPGMCHGMAGMCRMIDPPTAPEQSRDSKAQGRYCSAPSKMCIALLRAAKKYRFHSGGRLPKLLVRSGTSAGIGIAKGDLTEPSDSSIRPLSSRVPIESVHSDLDRHILDDID